MDLTKPQLALRATDLLGITPIMGSAGLWQSTSGTINAIWYLAVCRAIGIPYAGERVRSMKTILAEVGVGWDVDRHSSAGEGKEAGGNIRAEGYLDFVRALEAMGYGSNLQPSDVLDLHDAEEVRRQMRSVAVRKGQPRLRRDLLEAYDGRCAVTGCDVPEALDAAHIHGHATGGSMHVSNGLLLRSDIHTLFDCGLLVIDTTAWMTVVHPQLHKTASGSALHGLPYRLPDDPSKHPSPHALDLHRLAAGLAS